MQSAKRLLSGLVALLVVLGIVWFTNFGAASPERTLDQASGATATPAAARASATTRPRASATPQLFDDGLATVAFDRLPPEAQETIGLIEQGGPFPYEKDDATFGNRERLLPRQPSGYYREYTVVTPGSADRGARRIIAGADGELYYTADHYASFRRVVR